VRNRIEVLGQISVNHFGVPLINRQVDGPHGIERTALGTVPIGRFIEVRFDDRFEHQRRRGLHDPVADRGYTEQPLAHATGFRNHHASDRLRCVASGPNLLSQFAEPALHAVDLDARKRFPVHTWRSAIRPAERECVCEDVFTPHLVIQKMEPPRRLLLGLHVQRSLERPDSFGSCQAHANPLSSARPSAPRTRAPSLHRRYPVSSVLWAPPTPVVPVSRWSRCQVPLTARQASRVANHRVCTCRAHYPGEQVDLRMSVVLVDLGGLRLLRGDSAPAFNLSRPAQASLALRPAHSLARPKRTSVPGASMVRSPSPSPG
jgi:hypothetical protein